MHGTGAWRCDVHESRPCVITALVVRAGCSRGLAGEAEGLRRTAPRRPEDDVHGGLEVGPPSGVDDHRAGSSPGPHPAGDHLAAEAQRAGGPAHVGRPLPLGAQRPVRDPHRGQVELGAELEGQSGPAGMVQPGGVDEQHVRRPRQRAHDLVEQASDPQRQHPRDVRRARDTGRHLPVHEPAAALDHRRAPGRVAGPARPGVPAGGAHPAAADPQLRRRRPPRGRRDGGQPALVRRQPLRVPRPHASIVPARGCEGLRGQALSRRYRPKCGTVKAIRPRSPE